MKFLHLSDLHYSKHAGKNEKLDKMFKAIAKLYPEHSLIISGDITDDGHKLQYSNARKALEPFKDRLFLCPGNHDYGTSGIGYFKERAELFDRELAVPLGQGRPFAAKNEPVTSTPAQGKDRLMLIALNTCLETGSCLDFACGEVGGKQLRALAAILADPAVRSMKTILFFHHHLFAHTRKLLYLRDAAALMKVLREHPADYVLFGHLHKTGAWNDKAEVWNGKPGAAYVLAADKSPDSSIAREITYENNELSFGYKWLRPTPKP